MLISGSCSPEERNYVTVQLITMNRHSAIVQPAEPARGAIKWGGNWPPIALSFAHTAGLPRKRRCPVSIFYSTAGSELLRRLQQFDDRINIASFLTLGTCSPRRSNSLSIKNMNLNSELQLSSKGFANNYKEAFVGIMYIHVCLLLPDLPEMCKN